MYPRIIPAVGALAFLASVTVAEFPPELSAAQIAAAAFRAENVISLLETTAGADAASASERAIREFARERLSEDLDAMRTHRPGYPFWRYVFTIPDGSIAYGAADDGRLLAVFPARGDWTTRNAEWQDPTLASLLDGQRLPSAMTPRRNQMANLLEPRVGPVRHNATRGTFLLPNAKKYGSFLGEWGAIYERFGVPAEIGLAQAAVESGFSGTVRSEARAVGFCQWLEGNWNALNRLSPEVIEVNNQTTQAPYCAAYLTILTTKYGSFIPALSEHHTGGANVGRTVINGGRLGGQNIREQYLLGSEFARDLRELSSTRYTDVVRTYGPRSFLYTEMVFGNTLTVTEIEASTPQTQIFAMRAARSIPLEEVTRKTGLSVDEVRRFNPALIRQVPARANLYLPKYVADFGPDVSFWHRPAPPEFTDALYDFVRLQASLEEWDSPAFESVLREFQRRFAASGSEEGKIMATMLAYVMEETRKSGRAGMMAEFRSSNRIQRLFEQGVVERERARNRVAVGN